VIVSISDEVPRATPRPVNCKPLLTFSAQPRTLLARKETWTMALFRKLARHEQGATAIEYALIASLIAISAVAVMGTLGSNLNTTYTNVQNAL
jgi:pilus assembly protein Flp/PilA